jgi:DNA (cytosine-5)-methyltransferase 1
LFCGIGGLDLGFLREGFDVVWANDILPNAAAGYAKNLGHPVVVADLNDVPLASIPAADVVIGGPPCQPFSLMGLRRKDDPRGSLVFRFADVVLSIMPRVFVMENVPGMEASKIDGHRLPEVLATEFEAAGYTVTKMRLRASDYMVPQLRRRLFLIGHLGGAAIPLPSPDAYAMLRLSVSEEERVVSATAALGDLGPCTSKGERAAYASQPTTWLAKYYRRKDLADVSLHECPRMSRTDQKLVSYIPPGGNFRDVPVEAATGRILKYRETGGRSTTYGRLHPDRPSHTVNTYFRRPNVGTNFHYAEDRLITAREAMRLQSFPDDFELVFTAQQERNTQIGNAVPPLLAQAVAWSVRSALDAAPQRRTRAPVQQPLPWQRP